METTPGTDSDALGRPHAWITTVLVGFFIVVLALALDQAARRILDLDNRRTEALLTRSDPADPVGAVAGAFRRFRSTLAHGDRFALVFDADADRNQAGFYRLFAQYYLYPAIAVPDPADATAVMVFGTPPPTVANGFDAIATVDGVWLGRRRAR